MKHVGAIPRLWFAYLVMFPVQRWFGVAAAVLILLGLIFPSQLGWGWLAAFCFLVTVVIPSGWIFRMLSATRASRLRPYFRLQMLGAAVLLILAIAIVCAELILDAWVAFSAPRPLLQSAFAAVAVPIAAAASLWFWLIFFWPRSVVAIALLVTLFSLWTIAAHSPPYRVVLVSSVEQAAWTLVACWAAFCVWYLAAPIVKPFVRGGNLGRRIL